MPLFRKKPVTVQATQWQKNGDHPEDGAAHTADGGSLQHEGRLVRYFRHPNRSGSDNCQHCRRVMHDHGWIDTKEGGHIVCPGDWIITGVQGEHYPLQARHLRSDLRFGAYVSGPAITLDQQVAAIIREIGMRKSVYPGRVAAGKMKQDKADHETAAMEAVLVTVRDYKAMQPKVLALSSTVDALAEKLGITEEQKDELLTQAEKDAVAALDFAKAVKDGVEKPWPFPRGTQH